MTYPPYEAVSQKRRWISLPNKDTACTAFIGIVNQLEQSLLALQ
jgi:hypothetical protein